MRRRKRRIRRGKRAEESNSSNIGRKRMAQPGLLINGQLQMIVMVIIGRRIDQEDGADHDQEEEGKEEVSHPEDGIRGHFGKR